MAIIRSFSGDGLTPGAMSNTTAGTGDTPFNTVNAGFAIANEGARPPVIQLTKPVGSAPLIHWTSLGDISSFAMRAYFSLGSLPSGTFQLISTSSSADLRSVDLGVTTSGGMTVRDSANAVRGTIPGLAANTLYRAEVVQTPADTSVRLFLGHGSVPVGQVQYAMAGVPLNRFRLGVSVTSVTVEPIIFDDIAVSNSSEWIGPSVQPQAASPAYRWSGSAYMPLDCYRWSGAAYLPIDQAEV